MGVTGQLRTMSAGDLLQWIGISGKTGTLVLTHGEVEKTVFFRHGRIVATASNVPREYLGQFLLSHGYVKEEELREAMEAQIESKVLLGKILVQTGILGEDDLMRLLRIKAEEEVYDIFLWQEGDFSYTDDDLSELQLVPLNLDVTGAIMEGLRRVDEWARIRELIPDAYCVPVVVNPIDPEELPETQRIILESINGQRTIEQIVLESRSSEFAVSRVVYEFASAGHLHLVKGQSREPSQIPVVATSPLKGPASDEDELETLLKRAQSSLAAGEFEKSLRLLKVALNLDPQDGRIRNAIRGAEAVVAAELKKVGIIESKIPKLVVPLETLEHLNFNPLEGFILSRINGFWDIGSILKISPMRETDALLIFQKLVREKIVTLE
jgi:hypothetical protein